MEMSMVQQLTAPTTTDQPAGDIPASNVLTYEEFRAAYPDDVRAEWVEGEVILLMPPSRRHQAVSFLLSTLIGIYVSVKELGEMYAAPFEMKIRDGRSYREPDILVVLTENLNRMTEQRLDGPADLIVEIVSPESIARDRRDKLADYAAGGVREYWVVDPREGLEAVLCWQLSEEGYFQEFLPEDNGLIYSNVVPGLTINPAWLRKETLPSPLTALAEIDPVHFGHFQVIPPA